MHAPKFVDDDLEIRKLPARHIQGQSFRTQPASNYADKCAEVSERIGAEARTIQEELSGNAGTASVRPLFAFRWLWSQPLARRQSRMTVHAANGSLLGSSLLGLLALATDIAHAADVAPPVPPAASVQAPSRPYDVVLEIGGGASMRPAYEGAKDYKFYPAPIFALHYLWLPGFGEVKDGRPKEGFSISPSLRFVPKRDSNDYAALRGLNDVNAAFELGGRFAYTFGAFRPWVAVRYGFGGFEGIVGEAGLDMIVRPSAETEVTFGPRASFASRDYMQTYFGVTPLEAIRSGMSAYSPSAGFKGVGAEVTARYQFTPQWAVIGSLAYEKLLGDAADSPIVKVGDENQFTAKLGLSYRFGLKLFD
jgi:outer membrane protein